MQTKEEKLRPLIEGLEERNLEIITGKDCSKIMQDLGVEVL